MKSIKQKVENIIFGYNPNEFMPIYRDGKLDNKDKFVIYKIQKIIVR